jgi:hypothetical protein
VEKETGTGSLMVRMTLARSGQPIFGNHHRFIPGNGVIVAGAHASHRHYEMRRRSESPLHGEQKDRCCLDLFFGLRTTGSSGKTCVGLSGLPWLHALRRAAPSDRIKMSKAVFRSEELRNFSLEAWTWIYHGKGMFLRVGRKE